MKVIQAHTNMSPLMEEGLLIGVGIAVILILIGIIWGVFDWLGGQFSGLFDGFG